MDESCARCGSPAETHSVSELVDRLEGEFKKSAGREIYKILAIPFALPSSPKKGEQPLIVLHLKA